MTCSPARLLANRQNAAKSCGPKTAEGKARSRCNALKHGLTGDGVALTSEDAAEVENRFAGFAAELRPGGAVGAFLVQRAALFSVRLDRCAREETVRLNSRIEHAEAAFDNARHAEVDRLMADLGENPTAHVRRLEQMPEGVDRLIAAWRGLRADLHHPKRATWDDRHRQLAVNLMGRKLDDLPESRVVILSDAFDGRFDGLEPHEGAGLDPMRRSYWALKAMSDLIDAEIERLETHRETLDLDAIDRDRAAAPQRALLDTSHEGTLARKYEAAAERSFHRALSDLAQVEKATRQPAGETEAGRGQLASFFPEIKATVDEPEPPRFPNEFAPIATLGPMGASVKGSDRVEFDASDQRTSV